MKRYLWVVLALLFVNVNASLKDDFAQMDQAEDDLLSQIRSSAALGGAEEIVEERVTIESVQSEEGVESVPANVTILTANNTEGKITTKTIEAAFEKAGFFINDNRDMLPPFKR
ncbi:MAG: hypothetical protein U9O64_11230, partial [Campylobacterota bacterium]|nr:hypothetical protein [Campylobacterota bacterium]